MNSSLDERIANMNRETEKLRKSLNKDPSAMLSVKEAAAMLGSCRSYVYRLCSADLFETYRYGGCLWIVRDSFIAWCEERGFLHGQHH